MARIYIEKLSPVISGKIKDRAYTPDQLEFVYREVKKRQDQKQKGFLRAVVLAMVASILMPLLTLLAAAKQPTTNVAAIVFSSVATVAAVVLLLVGIKLLAVDRMMNQFLRALKIGYPEKTELYSRDSFRFGH